MGGAIGVRAIVANMIEEDHLVADIAITQRNAAWIRRAVDRHAGHTPGLELRVVEVEQGGEGCWLKAFNSIGHGRGFTHHAIEGLPAACAQRFTLSLSGGQESVDL
jgi:hypothetical protein